MDFIVTVEPMDDAVTRTRREDADRLELPTLGEIIDAIRAERPDCMVACDPTLREVRVRQVRIQVGREP